MRVTEYLFDHKLIYKTGFAIDDYPKFSQFWKQNYEVLGMDESESLWIVCMCMNALRALNMYGSPWLLACLSIERFLMMKYPFWAKHGITSGRRQTTVGILAAVVLCMGILYCWNTTFEFINNVYRDKQDSSVDLVSLGRKHTTCDRVNMNISNSGKKCIR